MDLTSLKFRPARFEDLAVLELWDTYQHVIDSDPDEDWNWSYELKRKPFWREQLMAELDNTPVGFLQIIDPQYEETQYWGSMDSGYRALDIWIGESENLGKGIGSKMMEMTIDRLFSSPEIHSILVDPLASNTRAHNFYYRLGFKFDREEIFNEQNCFILILKKI